MMVDKDQLYADLKEVRQLLAKGWCQANYVQVTPQGAEYCLQGAMRRVCNSRRSFHSSLSGMTRAIQSLSDMTRAIQSLSDMTRAIQSQLEARLSLVIWNDEPERTKQDVLNLVDKTIANLDLIVLTEWPE